MAHYCSVNRITGLYGVRAPCELCVRHLDVRVGDKFLCRTDKAGKFVLMGFTVTSVQVQGMYNILPGSMKVMVNHEGDVSLMFE